MAVSSMYCVIQAAFQKQQLLMYQRSSVWISNWLIETYMVILVVDDLRGEYKQHSA